MTTEKSWKMFNEIDNLKKIGYKKAQIARKLLISRPTVIKYFEMSFEEYAESMEKQKVRAKKTDNVEPEILAMIREYPDFTSAQVFDRLLEKHNNLVFCESTLRGAIRKLREKYQIPKIRNGRDYEMVDELPMGQQMQVDFGMKWVKNSNGKSMKIYVVAFVLSHSRYKYCQWQTKPFTTFDTIMAHENAFEYYGGIPQEVVYDQDHLILVSENKGDLIFTTEFTKYIKMRHFRVFMCRKADPQSKGKIENVIKYVKYNFAKHRIFTNIDKWNEECIQWLDRRGNGKIHETTKKIPAEVFEEEKKYLVKFENKIRMEIDNAKKYQVRKDNSVPIEGNYYSVPTGTYNGADTYVNVEKIDSEIIITEVKTGHELNRRDIPVTKGNKYINSNHKRDKIPKIEELMEVTLLHFSDYQLAKGYLENIKKEKPRYIRDQLIAIKNCVREKNCIIIQNTLEYCNKNKLYNATDFIDTFMHFNSKEEERPTVDVCENLNPISEDIQSKINIKPKIRDIEVYRNILRGYTQDEIKEKH